MAKTERNWLHRRIPRKENQPILGVYVHMRIATCTCTCVAMALALVFVCVCERNEILSDYGSECFKEMGPQWRSKLRKIGLARSTYLCVVAKKLNEKRYFLLWSTHVHVHYK